MVGQHSHQWLFGHGGGNGIRCALGDGDSIRISATSSEVTNFLEATHLYGGTNEAAKFLQFILDRHQSGTILSVAALVPTNGFSSREEYRSWLSKWGWQIDEALGEPKVRL